MPKLREQWFDRGRVEQQPIYSMAPEQHGQWAEGVRMLNVLRFLRGRTTLYDPSAPDHSTHLMKLGVVTLRYATQTCSTG
jgi:hypothetical protein